MDTEILEMPPKKKKAGRPKKIVVAPELPEPPSDGTVEFTKIDTREKVVPVVDHGEPPPPVKRREGGDDKPRGWNSNWITFFMMVTGVYFIWQASVAYKKGYHFFSIFQCSVGTFLLFFFTTKLKRPLFGKNSY